MSAQNGTAPTATTPSLDHIKDSVKHLVEQGQEKAGEIKQALAGAKDKVMVTGSSVIATSRNFIVDNPFKAIGIAFGVGYVAMRIFRR